MKAITERGDEAEGGPGSPEGSGVLRHLDDATLRRFLITILRDGGVSCGRISRILRCSKPTIYRDQRPSKSEA